MMANLEHSIPAGAKKFPKLYQLAAHPLQPHIFAVGCNTGAVNNSLRHLMKPHMKLHLTFLLILRRNCLNGVTKYLKEADSLSAVCDEAVC